MKEINKKAIFLIDGSSFLYRAYYALSPLMSPMGNNVQAIYGFCRMIKKVVKDFDPTFMVILWDSKGKTVRSEEYEDYKATRQVAPSDLHEQRDEIKKFADFVGLCQISKSGFEADDLIASIVKENPNHEIIIIASDKDLYQLVSDRVKIFDPFKKELIDRQSFIEKRGFLPEQLLMYHSLLGDASDNIPGVRGIGKVTAEKLVKQFGVLDELYENLDKVEKDRTRRLLSEQKEQAFLSKKLFTLRTPKTNKDISSFEFSLDDWNNAYTFFSEHGFTSMLKGMKPVEMQTSILGEGVALRVLEEPEVKQPVKVNWECIIIDTEEGLSGLVSKLKKTDFFALDVETTGLNALEDELVGVSVALDKKIGYYVPVAHKDSNIKQLDRDVVLKMLKMLFEDNQYKKTFHHSKFDCLVLSQYGINLRGIAFDSLLAANLVRKGWEKIGLKSLSQSYLNEPMTPFSEVLGKHKTFATVPMKDAAKYSAHDSLQTYKLKIVLEEELNKEPRLKKIFYDLDMPLCSLLYRMELSGMPFKPEIIFKLGEEVNKELRKIEDKIYSVVGVKINLNSPKQVGKLLFDDLGLPTIKTKEIDKRSTDQFVLEELSKSHPIPALILKYRELSKLSGTYIKPLPGHVNPKTKRIHTNFSQIDAATGRLASYSPNLQNIPTGMGYGIRVRSAFVAPAGKVLLSADYSQIELRVLAHISGDEALTKAFQSDRDIHKETAAQIFDITSDDVTAEQRQVGKRINFSIMYGLTPYGLSRDLGIKPSEAKEYISQYFATYPQIAIWMDNVIEEAKKTGYVETYLGRRRYFPGLNEANKTLFAQSRRAAINSPIQGTTAEIVKLAMLDIDKKLRAEGFESEIILQVHDEVILEVPSHEVKKVSTLVQKCMENVVDWDITLKVDIRTGSSWADITK